jgi:hypothetical protein
LKNMIKNHGYIVELLGSSTRNLPRLQRPSAAKLKFPTIVVLTTITPLIKNSRTFARHHTFFQTTKYQRTAAYWNTNRPIFIFLKDIYETMQNETANLSMTNSFHLGSHSMISGGLFHTAFLLQFRPRMRPYFD